MNAMGKATRKNVVKTRQNAPCMDVARIAVNAEKYETYVAETVKDTKGAWTHLGENVPNLHQTHLKPGARWAEPCPNRTQTGMNTILRDEKGIKKTVCAFLKLLHPDGPPSEIEFDEYVQYAVECRRRVKEQMNKRKPDDEFARINLSFITVEGKEVVVACPESKEAMATQQPSRRSSALTQEAMPVLQTETKLVSVSVTQASQSTPLEVPTAETALVEKHFTIRYGDTGHSYESLIGPYLKGATEIIVEDPYIRVTHQVQNFVRFCEAAVKHSAVKKVRLETTEPDASQPDDAKQKLEELKQSLLEMDIILDIRFNPNLHDREIRIDNGWVVKIGRGLDFYQKPGSWFEIGVNDLSLRKCLETKVDIFRAKNCVSNSRTT